MTNALATQIATGFATIDRDAPIEPGTLILLGASPGAGASSLAMTLLAHQRERPSIFNSCEGIHGRLMSRKTVPLDGYLLTACNLGKLEGAIQQIRPGLVVVDMLNHYIPPASWMDTLAAYRLSVATALGNLARQYEIAVLVIVRASRVPSADDAKINSDLRDVADQVWTLSRVKGDDCATLTVDKNRSHASFPSIELAYHPETETLTECPTS
jgi:hypothetical protein